MAEISIHHNPIAAASAETLGAPPEVPTFLRIEPPLLTVDVAGLSQMLHRTRASILSDRTRAPLRVPPAYVAPGSRTPLWIVSEVLAWLRAHPEQPRVAGKPAPRRPGRPTKAEAQTRLREQGGAR